MSSPPSSGATTPSDGSWVDVRAASAAAEGDEPPTTATRVSGKARGDDDGDASADAGCVGAGVERGSSRAPAAESNPGPRNTPDDIGDAVAALRSCAARRLRALAERLQPERSEDEEKDEEKDEEDEDEEEEEKQKAENHEQKSVKEWGTRMVGKKRVVRRRSRAS